MEENLGKPLVDIGPGNEFTITTSKAKTEVELKLERFGTTQKNFNRVNRHPT